MASKAVSISLTEAQIWKLEELERRTGVSKSGLIQRALMFLFTENTVEWCNPFEKSIGAIKEDLEKEYQEATRQS